MSNEIIEISLDNPRDIMKCIRHGSLKSGSNVFKAERHFPIREGAPRANEGGLMLVFRLDLDLIVPRESIHKGEYFISNEIIQDLINEWCGIVIFRTRFIQILKISIDSYCTFFFVHCNRVRYPFHQGYWIDEANFQ